MRRVVRPFIKETPMRFYDDPPLETAPIGGGPVGPIPTYPNPNAD